ncbi:hypothetical protein [Ruminococcus albus]|uniref:Uncharacterized protein n=1 Tax=Ruminococcus albus TaxID=1264 RepID=A0A1I1KU00_RUMAL|nr:hypothetical protein [Ruminococcus albus]SFC64201.1 hypothetical protein SAMN02910406_02082 [Ruminococcus albus]
MKKKIIAAVITLVLLILFVPIPLSPLKDGGTRQYAALTYKVVKWQRLVGEERYIKTSVYFFPDNFKDIDELWEKENADLG